MPDKAIDLIDEAASRLRIEIDSVPQDIDDLERRAIQLTIEQKALDKENDSTSRTRRSEISAELANLCEEIDARKTQWQGEKAAIQKIRRLKESVEQTKTRATQAEKPRGWLSGLGRWLKC